MAYRDYFDLSIIPDEMMPRNMVMSKLWRELHRAGAHANTSFAVAFPRYGENGLGSVLRVFAGNAADARFLQEYMGRLTVVRDYAYTSDILVTHSQRYEAFMMARITSGPSKAYKRSRQDVATEVQRLARDRRIRAQRHLPFAHMTTSTNLHFRLVVNRVSLDADSFGLPNGYGLSRSTQVVALPVVNG